MKHGTWIYSLAILVVLLILNNGCSNDPVPPVPPALTTSAVTNIGQNTSTSGGTITSDGGAAVTARGVCWSISPTPVLVDSKTTDGAGSGNFSSSITDLTANTTYYIKAYATNSVGTGYGNEITFTTQTGDIDGNSYNAVTIGTQVWMVENLKVTKYRNGDDILNVTDVAIWAALTEGGYCNLSNDVNQADVYGRLYNWYAVHDSRNIAPTGWHVATDAEWTTLSTYLGGQSVAGGKLKEKGIAHWCNPNIGATNESGFTALPGGARGDDFLSYCGYGFWWTATEAEATTAFNRVIFDNETGVNRVSNKKVGGSSVRCVKD